MELIGGFSHKGKNAQLGNSTVTELQINFGLLFNRFVLYSYDLSEFEYFL